MKKSTTTNKTPAGKGKAKPSHQPKTSPKAQGEPMRKAEDVQKNNDEHIDQDFPGYPHHPSHGPTVHNGSAGAFDGTEDSHDDDDETQDNDDFAMGD